MIVEELNKIRFGRVRVTVLVVAVFALQLGSPVIASQQLQDQMAELAKRVLQSTHNSPVTVGEFTGSKELIESKVNSGPGFEGILTDQLNALAKGVVQAKAKYEVKGDIVFATSQDPQQKGLKVIKVTTRLLDDNGDVLEIIPFKAVLDSTRSIAEALQFTGSLSDRTADGTQVSKTKRNEELADQLKNPTVHIDGTMVSSSAMSPYAIEVLVKPLKDHEHQEAKPQTCSVQDGQAFVEIEKDELYEVCLHNNSTDDVAVSLSVDGLDVFHFTKDRISEADAKAAAAPFESKDDYPRVLAEKMKQVGQPKYNYYIIHPNGYKDDDGSVYDGTLTVVGWHNSVEGKDNYLSFLVTEYGQGAVSKEGITARGKVGVIHASFAKCHPLAAGSRAAAGNETGFGPPRTVQQKVVNYEVDPPSEFVAVRYTRSHE